MRPLTGLNSEHDSRYPFVSHKRLTQLPTSPNMMAAAEYDAQAAPMHPPIRSRQIATSPISRVMCAVILLPTIASATSAAMLAARGEMAVGSDCSNSEGEWNCMTKSFQRCASGQWSVVMDTANGTICVRPFPVPNVMDKLIDRTYPINN